GEGRGNETVGADRDVDERSIGIVGGHFRDHQVIGGAKRAVGDIAVGVDRQQLERGADRVDYAAIFKRSEGTVARIGYRVRGRGALDHEKALADDRHVEGFLTRFVRALRELLGDAVKTRPLPRNRPRRLARRRGKYVAKLGGAALEADRARVRDIVRDDRHFGLGALEARERGVKRHGLILPGWTLRPAW